MTSITCAVCSAERKSKKHLRWHIHRSHNPSARRFLCALCPARFPFASFLRLHQKKVHRERELFQCPKCPQLNFRCSLRLQRHLDSKHGQTFEKKPFRCCRCEKPFAARFKLHIHMRVHSDVQPFNCPDCPTRFKSNEAVKLHRLQVHAPDEASFRCVSCSATFKAMAGLKSHVKLVHGKEHKSTHKCGQCNSVFPRPQRLKEHCWRVHSQHAAYCAQCGRRLSSKYELAFHVRALHNPGVSFDCSRCSAKFATRRYLMVHFRGRHGNELFACKQRRHFGCSRCIARSFATKGCLTDHLKEHHKSAMQVLSCSGCQRSFAFARDLNSHAERAHGSAKRKCPLCPADFPPLKHLRRHLLRLHGTLSLRTFRCQQCQKGFWNLSDLKRHVSFCHVPIKPFVCSFWLAAFSSRFVLLCHLRTHSSSRPMFRCRLCGAKLTTLSQRTKHERIHGGGYRFRCARCSVATNYRNFLVQHLNSCKGQYPCGRLV